MFQLSVKDLAGGMTYLQTSSLELAKDELAELYHNRSGCIILFNLETGSELDNICEDMECGVYISPYSKEEKKVFEKFSYPWNGRFRFFFDVYMDHTYNPESIEKELFIIMNKIPELFIWMDDMNVDYFTIETFHHHRWYEHIDIHNIFDTFVRCLSSNRTLRSVNLNIFYLYICEYPQQLETLRTMLNQHPTLENIYLSRHDQRSDKVIKLNK